MGRKPLGDAPMTGAQKQALHRQRQAQELAGLRNMQSITDKMVAALSKIDAMTCTRLRTKAVMAAAIDEIGAIASAALAARHDTGPVEARVVIGDSIYTVDTAYRRGAEDCRAGVPWDSNPYDEEHEGEAHAQWTYGHENEDDDETKLDALLATARI